MEYTRHPPPAPPARGRGENKTIPLSLAGRVRGGCVEFEPGVQLRSTPSTSSGQAPGCGYPVPSALNKISINLSPPLDFAILISYICRCNYEHLSRRSGQAPSGQVWIMNYINFRCRFQENGAFMNYKFKKKTVSRLFSTNQPSVSKRICEHPFSRKNIVGEAGAFMKHKRARKLCSLVAVKKLRPQKNSGAASKLSCSTFADYCSGNMTPAAIRRSRDSSDSAVWVYAVFSTLTKPSA